MIKRPNAATRLVEEGSRVFKAVLLYYMLGQKVLTVGERRGVACAGGACVGASRQRAALCFGGRKLQCPTPRAVIYPSGRVTGMDES
jgi:hypothetical protein